MGGSASVTEGCDVTTVNEYNMVNNINQSFVSNVVTNCTNMNITENSNFTALNTKDNGDQSNEIEINVVDSQDVDIQIDQKNALARTVQFIAKIETLAKTGMDVEQSAAIVAAIDGTAASASSNQTQQTAATAIEAEAVGPFCASVSVGVDNDTSCHNSTNVENNINTTIANNTTMNMTTVVSFSQETRQTMNADSSVKQKNMAKVNVVSAKNVKVKLNQNNEIKSAISFGASAMMAAETTIAASQASTSDVKTSATSDLTSTNITTQSSTFEQKSKAETINGKTLGLIIGLAIGGSVLVAGIGATAKILSDKNKKDKKAMEETKEMPCDNTENLAKELLVAMGADKRLLEPQFKDFKISDYDPTGLLQNAMSALNPVAGMINALLKKGKGPLKMFFKTAGRPVYMGFKPLISVVNKGIKLFANNAGSAQQTQQGGFAPVRRYRYY